MAKTTYKLTLPDGRIATRTSAHAYTHAVIGTNAAGVWGVYSFNSSAALAAKEAAKWTAKGFKVQEVAL